MNPIFANWKTSIGGAVLLAVGILGAAFGVTVPGFAMDPGPAIAAGISLLLAKDATK
jgi:hypothetical protein